MVGGGTIVIPELTYRRAATGKGTAPQGRRPRGDLEGRVARDDRSDDTDRRPRGATGANRAVRDEHRRPRDPRGGDDRREPGAGEGYEAPRGDFEGLFLALGATVRSAGEGGISDDPLEDFLTKRRHRLALSISYDEAAAGAFAGLDRPHTHDYTALAVAGARVLPTGRSGSQRPVPALTAYGFRRPRPPRPTPRLRAGQAALGDVTPHDDALASAWYRTKVLPVLVRRVLTDMQGAK